MNLTQAYLKSIRLERDRVTDWTSYPFSVPTVSPLDELELHPNVTFLLAKMEQANPLCLKLLPLLLATAQKEEVRTSNFQRIRLPHQNFINSSDSFEAQDVRRVDSFFALRAFSMSLPF